MALAEAPRIETTSEGNTGESPDLRLVVTDEDVKPGPHLEVTDADVAEPEYRPGDTSGLEDILDVGSAGRAYRVKTHDNGWKSAEFISNEHVDAIRANQDLIRDDLDEREAQYLSREGGRRNPDRAGVTLLDKTESTVHNASRALQSATERVSKFLAEKRDDLAERRTASEVVSDIGDKATSKWESVKSQRARRVAEKNVQRGIREQERQDLAIANKVKEEIKAEAKKEAREKALEKARDARARKAERKAEKARVKQEAIDAWARRTIERKEKLKAGINKAADSLVEAATVKYYTTTEKGSEYYGKVKDKAKSKKDSYHQKRGTSAAKRAEKHLNKTADASKGEEYNVQVRYEDGKDS